MIEIVSLTDEQLLSMQKRGEGQFFDRKSKRIRPASLKKTLCAFANAEGGEALVGMEDHNSGGEWDGFSDVEAANGHIQAVEELFPLGAGLNVSFLTHKERSGLLLHIEVNKRRDIVKLHDDKIYVRRSARNHPISSSEELQRLELNKGIASYEDATVNVPVEVIENSNAVIEFMLEIVPDANPEPWLKKQMLLEGGLPTVAGLLLFADEPQIALPKASIKIYRYKTIEHEGTRETLAGDPETVEGNAYSQIYDAVKRVREITRLIPVLGEQGMDNVEFPEIALHEIIANAVLHRDYSIDDNIHIRIFDNRIEIESPGLLPGHVTTKNILKTRSIRNKKIVRLINKFRNPPNKDVGEGLNSSFQAMRSLKLKAPEIYQNEASVLIYLKHERLGSAEENIISYLRNNGEINNSVGRELCAIDDANKMKRVFQGLVQAGVIIPIEGRSKRYAAYTRGPNFSPTAVEKE